MRTMTLLNLPAGNDCTYAHWQYSRHNPAPPLHRHDFHEVFWVTAGTGIHAVNGESRPLDTGLIALVRAEDAHGFSSDIGAPPLQFVNFAFKTSLWRALRRRHPGLCGAWFDEPDHRLREHRLDTAQLERLRQLSADLIGGARDALAAEALLTGLVGLLSHAALRRKQNGLPAWLATACEKIREPRHFAEGTAAFARLAGCSPAHLAREVRRHFQRTPTDLVNEARLTHAGQLLATTSMTILDVASECGYENLGHFYKLFQKQHGTSPHRYRCHAVIPVRVARST